MDWNLTERRHTPRIWRCWKQPVITIVGSYFEDQERHRSGLTTSVYNLQAGPRLRKQSRKGKSQIQRSGDLFSGSVSGYRSDGLLLFYL